MFTRFLCGLSRRIAGFVSKIKSCNNNAQYLLSRVVTQELVLQGCAVEFIDQLLDLSELVLNHVQTENTVQFAIILLFQHRYVLLQIRQPSVQTQQQTLQPKGLQGQRPLAWTLTVHATSYCGLTHILRGDKAVAVGCTVLRPFEFVMGEGFI